MIKASKTIPGIVYIELPAIAINIKCSPERIECILKGKSQTNIVTLSERYNYSEYITQTQTVTEEEAHSIVTLPTEPMELPNHKKKVTPYPDYLSQYHNYYQYYDKYCDNAIDSFNTMMENDCIERGKNYLIIKRELK